MASINQNALRDTYARWANVAEKLRHIWLDIIKNPEQWEAFATKVKQANLRRPAFQEEFARAIPGWKEL